MKFHEKVRRDMTEERKRTMKAKQEILEVRQWK